MTDKNELPPGGSEDKDRAAAESRPRVKDPGEISRAADEVIAQVAAGLMAPGTANTLLRGLGLQRSCAADAFARPAAFGDRGDAAGVAYLKAHPEALMALAPSLDPAAFQRIVQALRNNGDEK